ncbi:MAG: hypothetical protein M1562_01765 [Candidatus Marsarchaeota archaeon]|jgi:UDP-3-O-[3-hydroxymyristoyl] glucosamine N-acyltransferase|nr:hypothetical protein [Candidatus Marsarchaeota archaeon]
MRKTISHAVSVKSTDELRGIGSDIDTVMVESDDKNGKHIIRWFVRHTNMNGDVGGLVSTLANVSENTYIDAKSLVMDFAEVSNSAVINSLIGESASIEESAITDSDVGAGSIVRSTILINDKIGAGSNVVLSVKIPPERGRVVDNSNVVWLMRGRRKRGKPGQGRPS